LVAAAKNKIKATDCFHTGEKERLRRIRRAGLVEINYAVGGLLLFCSAVGPCLQLVTSFHVPFIDEFVCGRKELEN